MRLQDKIYITSESLATAACMEESGECVRKGVFDFQAEVRLILFLSAQIMASCWVVLFQRRFDAFAQIRLPFNVLYRLYLSFLSLSLSLTSCMPVFAQITTTRRPPHPRIPLHTPSRRVVSYVLSWRVVFYVCPLFYYYYFFLKLLADVHQPPTSSFSTASALVFFSP